MSTKAIIRIEGINYAEVFKYWDGDPELTRPWLEKFNSEFEANQPNDPANKLAQLLRSSERDSTLFSLDNSKYVGWGINPYNSGYAEYVYLLRNNGAVDVFPQR